MPCYDQSCTSADLVNIPSLVLSDTFNTWFDRTNQIIEVANAINIFDIGVGPTDGGLRLERGCSGSWYSGVAVLYVNPGAGIGVGTESFTNNYNKVIVDVARLQDYRGSTGVNPIGTDYYILSDTRDTRQGTDGTPKRILARRILPNEIEFGEDGNGTLTIAGNLNVRGNVSIEGTESFIDSNDLRIEDKIIELAYGRYAEMTVFDDGSATLTAGSFSAGMTAYYDDTQIPNEGNASTIGTVFSWSIGETGVSGTIRISSFTVGGVNDIVDTGNLVVTGGGYLGTLEVSGSVGIGDYFLNDDLLQPAGIVIKGAEGDKTFLWVCNAADNGGKNWNAFVSNKNLGVSGPANWILSSKFASHGYLDPTVNNNFTFLGEGDSYTKYSVGNTLVMEHSPSGNADGTTFGIVHMGSTGPHVLPGVPVYDWVEYFNADQLDGAHASTASVPWTIPIMGEDGRLGGDQVAADSIRKTFTVSGHAFSVGDVLRVNVDGSLTFSSADTIPTAEALGMVSAISGNKITLVTKGFISGLSGQRINSMLPLATGNVYYLSPTQSGGLIDDPDSGVGIETGEVRKAMLLAMGSDSGYVLNYTGVVNGDSTDVVYMTSFTPVGAIQPYAGSVLSIPRNWMLCDGSRLKFNDYSELYQVLGNRYYVDGTKHPSSTIVQFAGYTHNMEVGDNTLLSWVTGGTTVQANAVVTQVDEENSTVTFALTSNESEFIALATGTAIRIYGRIDGINTSIFFLPDLRRRTAIGSSSGLGVQGTPTPALILGQAGGSHQVTLNQQVTPLVGGAAWGNSTSTVDSLSPYVAINWIIRVKKGANATILEGHNHDLFYIRHDIEHSISGGAANNLSLNSRNQFRENARVLRDGTDGPDTFHNDLKIAGNAEITGGALIYNNASPQNTLGVSGRTTLGQPGWSPGDPNGMSYNALEVYGKTKLFADISVSTSGSFEGSLSAGGDLAVLGNMTVGKVLNNGTRVDGNARFWGSLTASTVSAFSGSITTDLTVGDDLRVGDDLGVTGDAYVIGTMSIGKTTPVSGFALDVVGAARSSVSTTIASNEKTLVTKDYVDSTVMQMGSSAPTFVPFSYTCVGYNWTLDNNGNYIDGVGRGLFHMPSLGIVLNNINVLQINGGAGGDPATYSTAILPVGIWDVCCYVMGNRGPGSDQSSDDDKFTMYRCFTARLTSTTSIRANVVDWLRSVGFGKLRSDGSGLIANYRGHQAGSGYAIKVG